MRSAPLQERQAKRAGFYGTWKPPPKKRYFDEKWLGIGCKRQGLGVDKINAIENQTRSG
jgi:hypothetical protein